MNFSRNKTQHFFENKVGFKNGAIWTSYKQKLVDLEFADEDLVALKDILYSDAVSYFKKANLSFVEAVAGIKGNRSTWATVKLYYSVFYSIRAELLLKGFGFVRCSGLYSFRINDNARRKLELYKANKVRGDHQLTISFKNKLHAKRLLVDPICDGVIDDEIPYSWMLKKRERVNYQERDFCDPETVEWLTKPFDYLFHDHEDKLSKLYCTMDSYIYCFDSDHAFLAIPFSRLRMLDKLFKDKRIGLEFSEGEQKHLTSLSNLDCFSYS